MSISISDFTPADLGFDPELFPSYRPEQVQAVDWTIELWREYQKRTALACLPPGAGKSLYAMTLAKLTGMRTLILTHTKSLQTQYLREFAKFGGLVDIRGKENYDCADSMDGGSCWIGQFNGCGLCGDLGCTYEQARSEAKQAQTVITNYSYWIRAGKREYVLENSPTQGMANPFELLVCDEGHLAMEALAGAVKITLTQEMCRVGGLDVEWAVRNPIQAEVVSEWVGWAAENLPSVIAQVGEVVGELKRMKKMSGGALTRSQLSHRLTILTALQTAMEEITLIYDVDWLVGVRVGGRVGRLWEFECVWPAQISERMLFRGIPHVVVMSATLKPIAGRMLGVGRGESKFREWKRVFPAKHAPVYHVPTVRMNKDVDKAGLDRWVSRIDDWIDSRLDRKGLIHTVSYQRQRYLMEHSRHSKHFICNSGVDSDDPVTAQEAFDKFATWDLRDGPAILIGPSFSTGWNFKGDLCRWQVISKIPFKDARSPLMKARIEREPQYPWNLAMQEFVQAVGRPQRDEWDWCETLIVDDSVGWFLAQNQGLAPEGFRVWEVSGIPAPMKPVRRKEVAA